MPGWVIHLGLIEAAPTHHNPAFSTGTPALSYWPTPLKKGGENPTKNPKEERAIITKRMKEPTDQSSP